MPEPRIQFAESEPEVLELESIKPQGRLQLMPEVVATPARLLQIAVERGADLAYVEKLMGLQERWEANQARKAFVQAMVDFKAEPIQIFKRKAVGYETNDGDFVGYKHAELSDVADAVVPALARHNLSHRWEVRQEQGRVHVTCTVTHRDGHTESVTMDAAPDSSGKKNAIQQLASAVTYLQRYTLLALTGLVTKSEDDDDGAATGDREPRRDQSAGAPPAQPEREFYPQDRFNANLPAWRDVIKSGRKTADVLIEWIETKHPLTAEQKAALRGK